MAERTEILNFEVKATEAISQMAKYNQEIDRLKETIGQLGKATDAERVERARLTEQLKLTTAARRQLSNEIQSGLKTEQLQKGSIRQMSAELANMKSRWKSMSEEERATNAQMLKDIQALTKRLSAAEAEIGEYQRRVGSYEDAIKSAIFGNSKLGSSFAGLASSGGGFAGMMSGAATSVKAFGNALWSLMANPAFLALAGLVGAGMAFKWFYDYNKGLEEATRLTREFLGVTGTELEATRNSIQATADAFGKDYKEVLQAVDKLTAQYGTDAASAIKTINDGFAAGADLNGDMLAKIQQYAPAFRDAGISMEELVALIQQTRSGVFSDQGLALIQTASKRIREMSTSTQSALRGIGLDADKIMAGLRDGSLTTMDVIRQVSAALREVPQNGKEAGEALSAIFGKQGAAGGLAMIEQLDTMVVDLDKLKESTGEWGKLQEQQIAAQAELNGVLSSMFDITDDGFDELNMQAKIFGTQLLTDILKGLREAVNWFIDLYNRSEVLRVSIASLGGAFKIMWSVVKNVVAGVSGALGNIAKGALDLLSGEFSAAMASFKAVGGSIGNAVYNIAGDVGGAMQGMDNAVGARLNRLSTAGAVRVTGTGGGASAPVGSASGGTTGGSASGGGASSRGGGGGRSAVDKEAERVKAVAKLEEQLQEELNRIHLKGVADRRQRLQEQTDQEVEALRAKYHAQGKLSEEGEEQLTKLINAKYAERDATLDKWRDEEQMKLLEMRAQNAQAAFKSIEDKNVSDLQFNELLAQQLEARMALLDAQEQAELEKYEGNEALKLEIKKKYDAMRLQLQQETNDEEVSRDEKKAEAQKKIEEEKNRALIEMKDAFKAFAEEMADQSKALAIAGKVIALGEIAVEQGKAIARGIAQAQTAGPFPLNIAAIATTITAILTGITQAVKAVKSAKFAEGGDVVGPGTDTSDSVPAMLSRGEAVMTAAAVRRYSPYLSAMNIDGGGVPIYGQGAETAAQQQDVIMQRMAGVVDGIRPVVSVVDINAGQQRVRVIEENASI